MKQRVGLCNRSLCDRAVVAAIRDAGFTMAFHLYTPAEALSACRADPPDILLLNSKEEIDLNSFLQANSHMKLVLLLDEPDFHRAREARWQGAAEVLLLPDDLNRLPLLVRQLADGAIRTVTESDHNRLTVVCSPKGGCGASTTAAGLALALAPDAVLVDLNLTYGGIETLLDLKPDRTVLDLAPLAAELEERHLLQAVTTHSSGLAVLCSPANGAPGDRLVMEETRAILEVCRRQWRHVIVDLPGASVEMLTSFSRMADQVLAVTTPDPVAMRSVHLLLRGGGLPMAPQVGLVVNRWSGRSPFRSTAVAARLGLPLVMEIPEDPVLAQQVALGQPIIPVDRKKPGQAAAAILQYANSLSPKATTGRRGA